MRSGGWEPVLFNETHDLASGVMTDHVYEDTIRSYEFASVGPTRSLTPSGMSSPRRSTPEGRGHQSLCSTPWDGRDPTLSRLMRGFGEGGVSGAILTDSDGEAVRAQILEATRYGDGSLKTARLAFVARDVPALGYRDLSCRGRVDGKPAQRRAIASAAHPQERCSRTSSIGSPLTRSTGAMTSLRVKAGDWEVLSGPGNVVARQTRPR